MFYETIELSSQELAIENAKTLKQEALITEIFKANIDKAISPSQMLSIFTDKYGLKIPITSIRRALSDLTKDEVLIKTSKMVTGQYHLPEHCWMYNRSENRQYLVEKMLKGVKNTADFANKIIEHSINKTYIQPALFEDTEKENPRKSSNVDK